MRGLIGGLVLVAGVGGLGWYATQGPAVAMQDEIAVAVAAVAGTAQHDVSATVSGRDITVTGTVEDAEEQESLFAAFDGVPGRRVVSMDGLSVLPVVSPYTAEVAVTDDGVTVAGYAPSADVKDALGFDGLEVANGEPDAAWGDAITASAAAAAHLQSGSISLSDANVTVSGQVADPTALEAFEAAMADLPEGYTATSDITLEDDGTPLRLTLSYDGAQLSGNGKIPADLAVADIAIDGAEAALDVTEAVNPSADGAWPGFASSGVAALGALVNGDLAIEEQTMTLTGTASPDGIAAAQAALAELPDGYSATTDIAIYDDGTPLRLKVDYDGTSVTGEGKIPANLAAADVVLAGATGTLDLQEADIPSEDANWPDFATTSLAALGALNSGQMALEGTTVILNGVGTPDGIAAAEAALADIPDGYLAITDFTVFDDGTPFRLSVAKDAVGLTAAGKVPADFADATGQIDPDELADVETAFITDESGTWPGIADQGLAALAALESGSLEITGDSLDLTGVAFSQVEQDAAIAALGDFGGAADLAISDAGQVKPLVVTYRADTGAQVSGSLPDGASVDDIAAALGIPTTEDNVSAVAQDSDADLIAPLAAVQSFLPELDSLTYTATPDETAIDATAGPGVNAEALSASMEAALGDTTALTLAAAPDARPAATTRTNLFTGAEEVFSSGYWLPTYDFFATPENCAAQSALILERDKVQFLSGSADLDVQSIRAINALSALALKCAIEGGVFVQVAGHTDNTGDAEANLALSQARADTVRNEMLDRGLARVVVTAQGFGDTQPIADNDTEEGRAANRRTAFNWNFE